ncbi:MAG: HD domain-containing protein [Termitinemataceae bacterium]|nr:MAG: HD domain-containing protein [Termitinemataceae bacterium]
MNRDEQDFRTLINLNNDLHHIKDVDLLLERILLEARKIVSADAGSIYVADLHAEQPALNIKYSQNDTLQKKLQGDQKLIYSYFAVPIDEHTVSGYCALKERIMNIQDVYDIPADAPYKFGTAYDKKSGYKTVSMLAVPLKAPNGKLLGIMQLINRKDKSGNIVPFSSSEDELLIGHFASSAAEVLYRAYSARAMIMRMIKMSELRDPKETGAHVKRVSAYAGAIYEKWAIKHNISKIELEKTKDLIKVSSLLHDVGKVAISDSILKKPAKFTDEEYANMQKHTMFGADLFDDPQSPEDVMSSEICLTHHENWDGSGYPNKLKGTQIPLWGRIVALADVFDALSSKRVYKKSWAEEEVLNEIKEVSGKKFDPEIVDIFFEILPEIKSIQKLLPEEE